MGSQVKENGSRLIALLTISLGNSGLTIYLHRAEPKETWSIDMNRQHSVRTCKLCFSYRKSCCKITKYSFETQQSICLLCDIWWHQWCQELTGYACSWSKGEKGSPIQGCWVVAFSTKWEVAMNTQGIMVVRAITIDQYHYNWSNTVWMSPICVIASYKYL